MSARTRAVLVEFDANPAAMAAEIVRLRARLAELEPVHRRPVGFALSEPPEPDRRRLRVVQPSAGGR